MLSNTFTNGNILRIFGRNQFYLRNAQAIENMAGVNHIVFDKTGTLTTTRQQDLRWEGRALDVKEENAVYSLAAQSNHPLSKALVKHYRNRYALMQVENFEELIGKGVHGRVEEKALALGSKSFITGQNQKYDEGSQVWVSVNGEVAGYFLVRNVYRTSIPDLIGRLSKKYAISVLSGDNAGDRQLLGRMLGPQVDLHFNQQPEDKLRYIQQLQLQGKRVMMIGDGLNDAGALKQSDVGVALTEDSNNFTPASDAILEASQVPRFIKFMQLAKANKRIVMAAFILSILYNIVGIGFAVQGLLSPMVAAILMPISSLSIVLVTFGSSNLMARWMRL
jgi:Cu+-exporting ATPase